MKRICPICFTELPEEANYCPICGKCMREVEEYTIQYTGAAPQTKEVSIKDCAISIGDFDEKVRQRKMSSALNQLEMRTSSKIGICRWQRERSWKEKSL